MTNKKTEPVRSVLCDAVRHVREAYGDTQEMFSKRIGCAIMTVSHFETARTEPRDGRILLNLLKVTSELIKAIDSGNPPFPFGGTKEETIKIHLAESYFRKAYDNFKRIKQTDRRVAELESYAQPTMSSLREWRLSCMARVAARYFPEQAAAMEKAAPGATSLVDLVLATADENQIDYARFEREVFALAERRALQTLKEGKKEQQ
jgi:hypothetical protein